MSFFSDSNIKPKLTEPKLVKKIVQEQYTGITFNKNIKDNIIIFFKNNFLIIIVILIIIFSLYWRYYEIRKKRYGDESEIIEDYEEDSEILSTED